jgi:hypothetical protein
MRDLIRLRAAAGRGKSNWPQRFQYHAYVNGGGAENKLETLPNFFQADGYPTGRCSVE